jgi:hypothetical protein
MLIMQFFQLEEHLRKVCVREIGFLSYLFQRDHKGEHINDGCIFVGFVTSCHFRYSK